MTPKRVLITTVAAMVVAIALVSAIVTAPAGATPDRQVDCVGCHGGGTYRGTTSAAPSAAYPAGGSTYTVAVGVPDYPGVVYNTGYWVANSTAAGATGTTTGVYGGETTSTRSYTATMTAPAAEGVYYYKVFGVEGTKSTSDYTNVAVYSIVVDKTAPVTADNADGKTYRTFSLALTPTDNAAGVAGTSYRIDGGTWRYGTTALLAVTGKRHRGLGAGTHRVEYFSTDSAGNVEGVKSCQVILSY